MPHLKIKGKSHRDKSRRTNIGTDMSVLCKCIIILKYMLLVIRPVQVDMFANSESGSNQLYRPLCIVLR